MTESELFQVLPSRFVAERNQLSKQLRLSGDRVAADRIKKLPKPTTSVWATNQLARIDKDNLAAFVDAHLRNRDRQLRLLAGEAEASLAATATRHEQRMLEHLVDRASRHLQSQHLGASKSTLERVKTNLRAAVIRDEDRSCLRRGTLVRDLDEPGFDALSVPIEHMQPSWLSERLREDEPTDGSN